MAPPSQTATLLCEEFCQLGEGPFWHDHQIWWVDIERGRLLSADLDGKLIRTISFGQCIGSAVPATDGTFLVALEREIARLNIETENWEVIARAEDVPEGGRFNDGKCDPRGRFVVGTMSQEGRHKTAALYSLRSDHVLRHVRTKTALSNGLAWSADGKTMYFIDTPERAVFAYDYDLETGFISKERVELRFPDVEGFPDGMTIDREDRLWIAFWDGGQVRCYRPETGLCERIIQVPCARTTSCCFGGPNLDRLFITTAYTGLSPEARTEQPLAGSLFICDPGTSGFPTSCFK